MGPARLRSSIDLGTNTCLLLIAERHQDGWRAIADRGDLMEVVRLGQGVDRERRLAPEAMDRTLACLKRYAVRLAEAGLSCEDTVAVATSQARDAQNGEEFFDRVAAETGFRFRVLSGDDEAKMSFRGALLPGMDPRATAVIDIGGGSTELVGHRGGISLDVGSVRFTERFFSTGPSHAVSDEAFWACEDALDTEIKRLAPWRSGHQDVELVGVAGTVTALSAWAQGLRAFDAARVDGFLLTHGLVHRQVEELKLWSPADRVERLGIEPGRADVLLAGAMILWRVMEKLEFPHCRVSVRGLRYGLVQVEP